MGMDVDGLNADSLCEHGLNKLHRVEGSEPHEVCAGPPGAYFRRNWWHWRPLWDYCQIVAPDLISDELHAACHSNSGLGLNGPDSKLLAERLRESLGGMAQKYIRSYNEIKALTPEEPCKICGGTGQRDWSGVDVTPEYIEECQGCNGCHGKGTRESWSTWYSFDEEDVQEFAEFLDHCGGFACY